MSQTDLQNRYADLLQPIRDLTRNWNVDVASQLEEYLDEIAQVTISFDNGVTAMNFAEAALLIQGSTCVYSRKVEYLHALVYQTLDLVQSKRKQGQAPPTGDVDSDLTFAQRMEDEQFLSLDDIHVAKNIDMDEQNVSRSVSTIPRTPLSLIPLMDYEKTNSIPLFSNEGELIGSHLDFRMNTSIVHHESGTLLLEPLEHLVLQVELNNGHSFTINRNTPTNQINDALFTPRSPGPVSPEPPDHFQDMDDSLADMRGDPPTPTKLMETVDRRRGRVRIAEEQTVSDRWVLLDAHDPGTGALNKPFKKGVTFRVPQSLSGKKERKRKQDSSHTPSEPLAEFVRRTFYTCSSQFPKNSLKAPLSSEFEGHYWAEQKRRRLQRKRDNAALKKLFQEVPESVDAGEESLDDYQPLGGDPPQVDDDMEAGFEGAFDGFNQSGGQVSNPFLGVEPMALDDSTSGFRGNEKVVQSYEDLVRNYVESTMMGVATYIQQTDLSRRVHRWEERIKPLLVAEEQRQAFDIHKYGASVIEEFKPADPKLRKECLYFKEIGQRKTLSDICRLFTATLQLANDGNVLIETKEDGDGEGQVVDSMKLTLLSTEMAHEAMSQYTAPSLKSR